ncbi:GNAT family N-acetyltransferase [Radiobacillus kanasensis]|nr:bifunctional GNAT family N-acetyltransferase/carbon-nitrogen hydrolase family protein [Radiobacillus kanasensis]UFU01451.1 GNAT family N-acetyltransferase [Radiobacillus kanasensis]
MSEHDLSKFEHQIVVRNMTFDDIDELLALARLGFGPDIAFSREHFESHLRIFPEGQVCIEFDGKIVGSCSSLIINFDEYPEEHTMKQISGNNFITNHNPNGKNLYGIDVVVHPEYRHMKIGRRLYQARRDICKKFNLKSILFGGRIPNYHKYADKRTPEEYAEQVISRKIYDPVLTFQTMNGFKLRRILPNYLPPDKDSLGYATLMEWANVDYQPDVAEDFRYKRSKPVRISSVQYMLREIQSFEDFKSQCEYFVDSSSKIRSDFVVFPENFTLQLLSLHEEKVPSKQVWKLTRYTPAFVELFSDLAIRYSINIVAGTHFTERDGSVYSVSYLFHRNGAIDKQYKLHITKDEKKWWGTQPGKSLNVFNTDCGKVAILIGYDIQFAELSRLAVDQGAQILFTPYSAEDQQGYLRVRYCAQARAIEHQVYTVLAGTVGHLPKVYHLNRQYGVSAIFSPSDFSFPNKGIIAESGVNVEEVTVGEVDIEMLQRNRMVGTVTQLIDRRNDIYRTEKVEAIKQPLEL